jgi:hypothetical protein
MTHNLMQAAGALVEDIFNDIVGDDTTFMWDLTPILMVDQTPQGPAPASKYVYMTYARSLLLGSQAATVSAFDIIPSPLLVLDGPFMRDVITRSIALVREMRSNQIDTRGLK